MNSPSCGLLVSVRSAAEAETAVNAGAALIDVKEPARGPLGRADLTTIAAVVRQVAGRRPVSAALGELPLAASAERGARSASRTLRAPRSALDALPAGLTFVKFGLASWRRRDWQAPVRALLDHGFGPGRVPQLVIAAYADAAIADAPPLDDVAAFARARPGNVLLVDTFAKRAGRTLLDWISAADLDELCTACHAAGVRIALAGSLGPVEITRLRPAGPDWFAVRGAVCAAGRRDAAVCPRKVRHLVDLVASRRFDSVTTWTKAKAAHSSSQDTRWG